MQDYVVAFGVDIFGIDEKSVHVKETGADFRESGIQCQFEQMKDWRIRHAYSGFAIIMMAVLVLGMADSWLVRLVLGVGVGIGAVI